MQQIIAQFGRREIDHVAAVARRNDVGFDAVAGRTGDGHRDLGLCPATPCLLRDDLELLETIDRRRYMETDTST